MSAGAVPACTGKRGRKRKVQPLLRKCTAQKFASRTRWPGHSTLVRSHGNHPRALEPFDVRRCAAKPPGKALSAKPAGGVADEAPSWLETSRNGTALAKQPGAPNGGAPVHYAVSPSDVGHVLVRWRRLREARRQHGDGRERWFCAPPWPEQRHSTHAEHDGQEAYRCHKPYGRLSRRPGERAARQPQRKSPERLFGRHWLGCWMQGLEVDRPAAANRRASRNRAGPCAARPDAPACLVGQLRCSHASGTDQCGAATVLVQAPDDALPDIGQRVQRSHCRRRDGESDKQP